jgi:hypothetical protein
MTEKYQSGHRPGDRKKMAPAALLEALHCERNLKNNSRQEDDILKNRVAAAVLKTFSPHTQGGVNQ